MTRAVPSAGNIAAGLLLTLALATAVQAQSASVLPEVTVHAPASRSSQPAVGGANGNGGKPAEVPSFDRLNRELKRKVDETNPGAPAAPIDARSPDIRTGVVNIPAVQQQYGRNFGHSAIPYRPAPPVYSAPLGHH